MKKAVTTDRMIAEFPARQLKRRVLFDVVRRINYIDSAGGLSGSSRRHSEQRFR